MYWVSLFMLFEISDSIESLLLLEVSIVAEGASVASTSSTDTPPNSNPSHSYYVLSKDLVNVVFENKILEEYSDIYEPLIGRKEFAWLENYVKVLSCNPRTLKRILNIYILFWHVRKFRDQNAEAFDYSVKKLQNR